MNTFALSVLINCSGDISSSWIPPMICNEHYHDYTIFFVMQTPSTYFIIVIWLWVWKVSEWCWCITRTQFRAPVAKLGRWAETWAIFCFIKHRRIVGGIITSTNHNFPPKLSQTAFMNKQLKLCLNSFRWFCALASTQISPKWNHVD